MAEILGKVTAPLETPRGADVSLRISVPRLWLFEGRTIEVELPRHLTCAQCFGGGCGACGNSGAITVRSRGELPEMIQVSLPEQGKAEPSSPVNDSVVRDLPPATRRELTSDVPYELPNALPNAGSSAGPEETLAEPPSSVRADAPRSVRPVTIRIPECGGLPESGSVGTVRGWLLLHVTLADAPTPNVRLLDDDPLSSSKMLRAEVKSMLKTDLSPASALSAEGETARGKQAPKDPNRSHVGGDSSASLTRPARTVSVRVRGTARVPREDEAAIGRSPSDPPAHHAAGRRALMIGALSSGFVVAVVLFVLWYVR